MMRTRAPVVAAASVAASLAGRYVAGRSAVEQETRTLLAKRLSDLGEVEQLTILPVVERLTSRPGLQGEPGVSYLLHADDLVILFDAGLGSGGGRGNTVLEANVHALGLSPDDLDCIVVSHLHADHVGGPGAQLRHTFGLGPHLQVPRGLPAYVPTDMSHPRADVCVNQETRVLGKGVALLPPMGRMLFWLGLVAEQALVVNVRGRGLVLVTGCGHPEIERLLAATEQVVDAPVHAVVGGLHLPVHAVGTPLVPQAVLGNPGWPWRPISEGDARSVVDSIRARGPGLVALSGHDSTPWTMTAFEQVFGERYRPLRVGEPLTVSAP